MRLPAQIAYRAANWDTPLWVERNRSGGRFNEPLSEATQYLCLHPLGPWAEMARALERQLGRAVTEPDLAELEPARRYWLVRLPELEVFDLGFDSAPEVGLSPLDLVDDDHSACRRAARLHGRRLRAWRYPSAALPGTYNLAVFGERRLARFDADATESAWPGVLAADLARMPLEVLPLMRHLGGARRSHPAVRAWRSGAPLRVQQPLRFRWPRD